MFEMLNNLLLEEYVESNKKVDQQTKERFLRHLEICEEDYKRRMCITRRGNNVLEIVNNLCDRCGHLCVCVIPSIQSDNKSVYKVIARNKRDNTYSYFRYSTMSKSLFTDSRCYGNTLKAICRIIGLRF